MLRLNRAQLFDSGTLETPQANQQKWNCQHTDEYQHYQSYHSLSHTALISISEFIEAVAATIWPAKKQAVRSNSASSFSRDVRLGQWLQNFLEAQSENAEKRNCQHTDESQYDRNYHGLLPRNKLFPNKIEAVEPRPTFVLWIRFIRQDAQIGAASSNSWRPASRSAVGRFTCSHAGHP
jgi:hypothetical protein